MTGITMGWDDLDDWVTGITEITRICGMTDAAGMTRITTMTEVTGMTRMKR